MERMTGRVRQSRVMDPRPPDGPARLRGLARLRRPLGPLGPLGLLGGALLLAALAGCGSVVASGPSAAPSTGGAAAGGAAATTATTAAPQAGCAGVNQATAVSIRQMMRGKALVGTDPISPAYRQVAQVRALFGQLCAAVTHPAPAQMMHCPADFGTEYVGTFYDGSRMLATFTYASTGCERVSVTAAGKTMATMVYGRAAAAAPHLLADLDAIVAAPKPGATQSQGGINPGGPDSPA